MRYWILLLLAIATEITGTLAMKWANVNGGNSGYLLMSLMITMSYVLLSFAIRRIALGVAYAMWEGVGILFITLFSVILFNETLTLQKVAGLLTLVTGIALIKTGTLTRSELHYGNI